MNKKKKPEKSVKSSKDKTKAKKEKKDIKEKKAKKEKKEKKAKRPKPPKVVRDSFTMPENDYAKIKSLKAEFLELGLVLKKGELLRAGLYALERMDEGQRREVHKNVEPVKTGRPKK